MTLQLSMLRAHERLKNILLEGHKVLDKLFVLDIWRKNIACLRSVILI
ncbi:MAG: hypothetical protein V9819_01870 [Candidatus Dasytiphilus stammeri]